MRSERWRVGIFSLAGIMAAALGGVGFAATSVAVAQDPVAPLLGQRLVTLAYNRSRATALSPKLAAEEAEVFLLAAQRVEPTSLHTLKLLVEAAGATGDSTVERTALRDLIRLDPGDLVAQVKYIDLLASATEIIDERAKIFQGALNSAKLDPQIRSEMAVRLANIAQERGDDAGAKALVQQALQLNDVNIAALIAAMKAAGPKPSDHLAGIVAILKANPLEPDAWQEMSQLLATAGLHDQAADYLATALEQYQLAGIPPSANQYLELAIDLATAGRRAEAYPVLEALVKLPDAPLSALFAARLLANEYSPKAATTTTSAPATQPTDDLAQKILARLKEAIKADPQSPSALADAVWVELSAVPEAAAETVGWLKALAGLVDADDPVLLRLEGWQFLRDGKLEEARAILEKAAPADPLAQLGLVRVLSEQNKTAEAAHQLEDLWWTHPTGIFAMQVAQTARASGGGAGGMKLTPTVSTQALLPILAQLPSAAAGAHRQPRDLQLVTASFSKANFAVDDPILLRIRMNNTTDHAVPVGGGEGMIKTTIALSGRVSGASAQNIGMYAIEDLQRVYRLEPRSAIEANLRVDQGPVAELLSSNPRETFTVQIGVTTAPRGSIQNAVAGLGGQNVPAGEFERIGYPMGSGTDIQKLLEAVPTTKGREQAVNVEVLSLAVGLLSDEAMRRGSRIDEAADAAQGRTALRAQVTKAIVPVLKAESPLMRAWVLLNLPSEGLNELQDQVAGMSGDTDPLVRMVWARKMALTAEQGGMGAAAAVEALQKQANTDQDALVKRCVKAMVDDIQQAVDAAKKAAGN